MLERGLPNYRETVLNDENFSKPWFRFFDLITNRVGLGNSYSLGGRLTTDTTSVGNVGSGADDLITFALEKNTLLNTGDALEITAYGTQAANANNKTIKLLLGSTELFSTGAVASNDKDWELTCRITRTGVATQKCTTSFNGDTVLVTQTANFVSGTENFATALTIKCTGEATSDNDIVQQGLIIKFFPVR